MQQQCDVLIVGGGLGGLALANALQALQLDWQLAEAAAELRTATGTLVGLGNNGMRSLEAINPAIPARIRELSQMATASERHLHAAAAAADGAAAAAPPAVRRVMLESPLYTIRWAAVQNILAELLDDASRVRCSHACTGYTEQADGWVVVHFEGQPDIRARLVVGADGVRSAVRRCMFPDEAVGPRYLGYMNWNAVRHVPGSGGAPGSDTVKVVLDQPEAFNAMVYLLSAGCDHKFWQVRVPFAEPSFTNGTHGAGGVPGSKARVLGHLRTLGPAWQEVIDEVEATDEAAIYERALWDRLPLPSWSSPGRRVVLLGDAAHAMYPGPGQGARTAFEDAQQLMAALQQHWPDVPAAVAQYEAARISRATTIQHYAAGMANVPGLRETHAAFWRRIGSSEDAEAATRQRFMEFSRWMNAWPDAVDGLAEADATFVTAATLAAFRQHCAAVTAQMYGSGGGHAGSTTAS